MDYTIFVTGQFKVKKPKFRHAVHAIDSSNAPVLGVIMNQIRNTKAAAGYGADDNSSYSLGYELKLAKKYRRYYAADSQMLVVRSCFVCTRRRIFLCLRST